MRRRIVLHCPEIALKGRNQPVFRDALLGNVRHVLEGLGLRPHVGATRGRLHVDATALDPAAIELVMDALTRVPGIASLADAVWLPPAELGRDAAAFNWTLLEDTVVALAEQVYEPGCTFAVNMKRVHKGLPVGTVETERRIGAAVQARTAWARVDLAHPDRQFHIDAYPDGLHVYVDRRAGVGGLPVGTVGHVLALVSGGIDSPVAAFMMARRGCIVDALHVTPVPLERFEPGAAQVARLMRQLSRYTQRTRLYVVPDLHFDLALRGAQSGYEVLLFRRFMLRAAEYVARRLHIPALVLGDSLGQVASQTLENVVAVSAAVTMPVLRPLIGCNKDEIIAQARRLGTYAISIEPHKDCCALLARHPRTRSSAVRLDEREARLFGDYAALLARSCDAALRLEFDGGRLVDSRTASTTRTQ
jgi:thiamine biosynthesis protein ThiI